MGKAAVKAWEKKKIIKFKKESVPQNALQEFLKFYFPFKENKTGNFRTYLMRMVYTRVHAKLESADCMQKKRPKACIQKSAN